MGYALTRLFYATLSGSPFSAVVAMVSSII
jgi:hypothetical protein